MPCRSRAAGEAGTGLVSTLAGLVAFLAFLLFAVQLILNLYVTSTVTAAASDAVRLAAAGGNADDPAALAAAEGHARALLGRLGAGARFTWSVDGDTVRLRVEADAPSVALPGFGDGLGFGHVDRTVEARVEDLR